MCASVMQMFEMRICAPPETASIQRLHGVGSGPELQHRLSRHAAQPVEGRALAAGDFQHLPPAVRSVPAEHGLHSGPGAASVSSSQVCIRRKDWSACEAVLVAL